MCNYLHILLKKTLLKVGGLVEWRHTKNSGDKT
jgi:hypothetical protein